MLTPYLLDDKVLIDAEQIIPIKDAEDFLIKLANKKLEENSTKEKNQSRHLLRSKFWTMLLREMKGKSDLFGNISPSQDNWISCGSGYSGIEYVFSATGNYARIELWVDRGSQEESKKIFDDIKQKKEEIEAEFGETLDWQRKDEGKGSRIALELRNVSIFIKEDWGKMIEFMTKNMIQFEKVMKSTLKGIIKKQI